MQLQSGKVLVLSFLISLALAASLVAASVVEVSLVPTSTHPSDAADFSLSVNNLGGDNINQVKLTVPQSNDRPIYAIKEIGNPVGWMYESRHSVGSSSPFKIIWSTSGSGISAGQSMTFNFVATSPESRGDYEFEWMAVDLRGEEDFNKVTVTNFNPVISGFDVKVLTSLVAGSMVNMVVTAVDQNNEKKSDYTGTIEFSSSDPLAIVPSDYTFTSSDNGSKTFRMRLKTVGEQEIKVSGGGMEKSVKVNVRPADASYIRLGLSNDVVSPNSPVVLNVSAFDVYGNTRDVTKQSTFSIDSEARGKLTGNTYEVAEVGKWTIIASYYSGGKAFTSGALLTVAEGAQEPAEPDDTETTAPEKKIGLEISADSIVEVPFNSTKFITLTVENTGDEDVSNVSIYFTGYKEEWLDISPSIADIEKGKSQEFKVTLSAPEKIEVSDVEFVALSKDYGSEKLNASKIIKVNITDPISNQQSPSTGRIALSKNLTYLGIAVAASVLLIVLFWVLFLKEEGGAKKEETVDQKKKKTE